jgi:hypothetical protein
MAECPDCDAPRIVLGPPQGNGRCSHCHGEGMTAFEEVLDNMAGAGLPCSECGGTGQCQTCGGTGEA